MENELRCAVCLQHYKIPLLLPCSHSVCSTCAASLTQPLSRETLRHSCLSLKSSNENESLSDQSMTSEFDRLSLVSDSADSGVICGNVNCIEAMRGRNDNSVYSMCIKCPVCRKLIYMDQRGVEALPRNTLIEKILVRFYDSIKVNIKCEMCDEPRKDALFLCEQCQINYCKECRERYHPFRGALVSHTLTTPKQLSLPETNGIPMCAVHSDAPLDLYCKECNIPCCEQCLKLMHTRHVHCKMQTFAKSQKGELSKLLQSLTEKVKAATEFLSFLNSSSLVVESNADAQKKILNTEIDRIIESLHEKRNELMLQIDNDKQKKIDSIKEQISNYSVNITTTTGLLQFCVAALKEPDYTSFVPVSDALIHRVSNVAFHFSKDLNLRPATSLNFDLSLNSDSLLREIQKYGFRQIKVPPQPKFLMEECSYDEDSVTLAWYVRSTTGTNVTVQGNILELDDGTFSGKFNVVYTGPETMCIINGLHNGSVYNARVKVYNQAGESQYSECISLHSANVYRFTFNPMLSHPDVLFSNDFETVTGSHYEERVVLGSVGFSKGIHYWEFKVNRYENHADPAFGIARYDCAKDHMLGKDNKSWCMYTDSRRTWFMHNSQHYSRVEKGIYVGSVIGVLLDLQSKATLTFFIDDELIASPVTFTNLTGVFHPALSVNKHVEVTLTSGLDPPCL